MQRSQQYQLLKSSEGGDDAHHNPPDQSHIRKLIQHVLIFLVVVVCLEIFFSLSIIINIFTLIPFVPQFQNLIPSFPDSGFVYGILKLVKIFDKKCTLA